MGEKRSGERAAPRSGRARDGGALGIRDQGEERRAVAGVQGKLHYAGQGKSIVEAVSSLELYLTQLFKKSEHEDFTKLLLPSS